MIIQDSELDPDFETNSLLTGEKDEAKIFTIHLSHPD